MYASIAGNVRSRMSPNLPNFQAYSHVSVRSIRTADLLLFRRRGLIAAAGRSIYSHAGMAAWWRDGVSQVGHSQHIARLYVLEMVASGGRVVPLRSQVQRYPGRWDLFHADPDEHFNFDRFGALTKMQELAGRDYGFAGLLVAACLHLPVIRLLVKPDLDDDAPDRGRPPFCSQALAMAYRLGGGIDVVKQLADRLVEPADLARSTFFSYQCTLVP